jgi:hypothetical protein
MVFSLHIHISWLSLALRLIGRKLVRFPQVLQTYSPDLTQDLLGFRVWINPQLNCLYSLTTNRYRAVDANRFNRSIPEYAQNIVFWYFPTKILQRVMIRCTQINKKAEIRMCQYITSFTKHTLRTGVRYQPWYWLHPKIPSRHTHQTEQGGKAFSSISLNGHIPNTKNDLKYRNS